MVVCKFFQRGNCYYGNSCRFEHTYDSKYSYRAPQLETTKNSQTAVNSSKSSGQSSSAILLFRNAVQNTSAFDNISSHAFSSSQPARQSVFDRLGPQPSSVFSNQNQQNNQARSIFAQANQSVFGQPQPVTNVFPTHNQSSNVFQTNNHTQNIFQTHNQPSNVFQTHNQSANVFQMQNQSQNAYHSQNQSANAKSVFAQATQSIFGQQQTPNTDVFQQKNSTSSIASGDIFQISNKPTSNVFGINNISEQIQINDDEIYSKIGELSQSDIDAFESDNFRLGFIPELPPPKLLCAM
ncbi:nucleoporin-like protein amo1 [Pararge aegeria]|uniref:Nucleoporin NUP42 n=2 Tax=Pararge aegeria TaxID=116150 RepID=A0A8S4SP64_9NEOP|nr:nucleoporin-like protein amo1 [Pararge aegeria]CAH2269081.1 jg27029 [Pararge aegeria aegeria]